MMVSQALDYLGSIQGFVLQSLNVIGLYLDQCTIKLTSSWWSTHHRGIMTKSMCFDRKIP